MGGLFNAGDPKGFVDKTQFQGNDQFRGVAQPFLESTIRGDFGPLGPGGVDAQRAISNELVQPVVSQFAGAGRGPGRSGLIQPEIARVVADQGFKQAAVENDRRLKAAQSGQFLQSTSREPYFENTAANVLGSLLAISSLFGGGGGLGGGVGGLLSGAGGLLSGLGSAGSGILNALGFGSKGLSLLNALSPGTVIPGGAPGSLPGFLSLLGGGGASVGGPSAAFGTGLFGGSGSGGALSAAGLGASGAPALGAAASPGLFGGSFSGGAGAATGLGGTGSAAGGIGLTSGLGGLGLLGTGTLGLIAGLALKNIGGNEKAVYTKHPAGLWSVESSWGDLDPILAPGRAGDEHGKTVPGKPASIGAREDFLMRPSRQADGFKQIEDQNRAAIQLYGADVKTLQLSGRLTPDMAYRIQQAGIGYDSGSTTWQQAVTSKKTGHAAQKLEQNRKSSERGGGDR